MDIIGALSWIWMIGMVAAQLVAARPLLGLLDCPSRIAIFVGALAMCAVSILPIDSMGLVFKCLLVISTFGIIYVFWRLGAGPLYASAPRVFVRD